LCNHRRDRNRIAIQADILGAAANGVRNFVFMAGDRRTTATIRTPSPYLT